MPIHGFVASAPKNDKIGVELKDHAFDLEWMSQQLAMMIERFKIEKNDGVRESQAQTDQARSDPEGEKPL
ncbi:MAG TPA: hypothetical protein V6C82_05470 [Chroococcales cyanobacterium]